MGEKMNEGWQFWIDRGGTFTDIVARTPNGKILTHKLLSDNPEQYKDAALAGIRKFLEVRGTDTPIPTEKIDGIKMGTTVATNALLERAGSETIFVTTKGFGDSLAIGDQTRPYLFTRQIVKPKPLYQEVVEVDERVNTHGKVLSPLDKDELVEKLRPFLERGINSVAIAFVHSYSHPKHEQQAEKIVRKMGFGQVSLAHNCGGLMRFLERAQSAVVDAYLTPVLRLHVESITRELVGIKPLFMQSNGGLVRAKNFRGKDSILSGPAGGIVGAVRTAEMVGIKRLITFDMGGTSTDIAHYNGEFERTSNTVVGGIRLQVPTLQIHTIAAGGGSLCSFDGNKYRVGPESAGANPGPVCYRRGGPLCVTDCNVMLGKIRSKYFPQVFGHQANAPIDVEEVHRKFKKLASEVSRVSGNSTSPEEVAEGFIRIAVGNMVNAIKKISLEKGRDLSRYTLCCFGGAGGQHACSIAESLGMERIFIHPQAGTLSAYGMGLAEIRSIQKRSVEKLLDSVENIESLYQKIEEKGSQEVSEQGVVKTTLIRRAHLRYQGSDTSLSIPFQSGPQGRINMVEEFKSKHREYYGFTQERPLILATLEVEVVEDSLSLGELRKEKTPMQPQAIPIDPPSKEVAPVKAQGTQTEKPIPEEVADIYFQKKFHPTPIYDRKKIQSGSHLIGPAVIVEKVGTTVVEPGWNAQIDENDNLLLKYSNNSQRRIPVSCASVTSPISHPSGKNIAPADPTILPSLNHQAVSHSPAHPVLLEIFNNLFMSIAEQMGVVLERTSLSVNIKERRDFSCALFDSSGALIANAPHMPVHLGSMSESVRGIIQTQGKEKIQDGEVYALNDPYNGGTHLPDITVVTPVFEGGRILFFVGSRGHHADIGGKTPGSMPSDSNFIEEEGILLKNITLVREGRFCEREIFQILSQGPYPSRNPEQNIADLKAQIAANKKGVQELKKVVKEFGLDVVNAYVHHVQQNAKEAVSRVISRLQGGHFCQKMDGGQVIKVNVEVNPGGEAVVDFRGTSPQLASNFNAPSGVCRAAVLYVFRTLVDEPIPMNEGVLAPIQLIIPKGSMLSPSYPAPVAAGNVETSQGIVEALYGALGIMAQAQGTMNNLSWGDEHYQYYETICGGSGAGPGFHGCDGVQTHMTNSRLTDPEVLEWNFPVLLEGFSLRRGSGGLGRYRGGDGTIRRVRFLKPMTASILSERRVYPPLGMNGGEPGKVGRNYVERASKTSGTSSTSGGTSGAIEKLPGSARVELFCGDVLVIETPGGGGFGQINPCP